MGARRNCPIIRGKRLQHKMQAKGPDPYRKPKLRTPEKLSKWFKASV